ncbi:unnamed protein product [Blepharisma stoltei]|uniref:Uncharacterized protein n=1 Tax=Blepharisma stoltei TaxID=1481888 RepID=A0AAU9JY06_9CILI|nr:unnamed protein product [Blepharisma stoltei]
MQFSEPSREPTIKEFILHLNQRLKDLKQELNLNRTLFQDLKGGVRDINHIANESCNDITNSALNETEKLEKNLKNKLNDIGTDVTLLKHQLFALNQGKIKIQQDILLLDSRVMEQEKHVGIQLGFPDVDLDS